jgi:hypothetical protein
MKKDKTAADLAAVLRVKNVRHCEEGIARRSNPVDFFAKRYGFSFYLGDSHASVHTGSE